jgi:DNA repair exonuclease SbcCD ATPase subunit
MESTLADIQTFAETVNETGGESAAENLAPSMIEGLQIARTEQPQQIDNFDAFSADDIAKAREQEKQKLYPQLEKLKDEVASLRREREEREAEEARLRAEQEAEARRRAEEEMDVRELLKTKEQEWSSQLEQERVERERAIALLEQERQFQELHAYRQQRLEAERENIIPELIDLIDGSTPDEIESSIASLKDRSSRILESAQQAMTSARRDMTGSRVTAPASGPLDTDSENRSFSPEDIRNMSVTDYQKYRERLLGSAAANRGRGLFG